MSINRPRPYRNGPSRPRMWPKGTVPSQRRWRATDLPSDEERIARAKAKRLRRLHRKVGKVAVPARVIGRPEGAS